MAAGVGGLMLLPPPDGKEWELFAVTRISDLPAPPCSQQTWPNADRGCLTWTAARPQTVQVDEAAPADRMRPGLTSEETSGDRGRRVSRSGASPSQTDLTRPVDAPARAAARRLNSDGSDRKGRPAAGNPS
jgi:hypothetical protein